MDGCCRLAIPHDPALHSARGVDEQGAASGRPPEPRTSAPSSRRVVDLEAAIRVKPATPVDSVLGSPICSRNESSMPSTRRFAALPIDRTCCGSSRRPSAPARCRWRQRRARRIRVPRSLRPKFVAGPPRAFAGAQRWSADPCRQCRAARIESYKPSGRLPVRAL